MIRDIFIPSRIGSYYLFAQRIVGVDIQPHAIYLTVLYLHKNTSRIEKQLSKPLAENSSAEHIAHTLKELFESVGSYDHVATVLPSSSAVFKTITLPFTNKEKIGMVIGYELEPQLPFALSDAAIGFITTNNNEHESTEVVAVAVKKEYLQAHKEIFERVGITPELISIDNLVNFEIIKNTETFRQRAFSQPILLITIKDAETDVSYIVNGTLKLIRTLPTGLYDVLKKVAQKTNSSPAKIRSYIDQYGVLSNPDHTIESALQDAFTELIQSISFTSNTFSQRVNFPPAQTALLVGPAQQLKDMDKLISQRLSIPCVSIPSSELFPAQESVQKTSQDYLSSYAAAHAFMNARTANIATQESTKRDLSLFTKQAITTGVLSLLLLGALGVTTFMQLRGWSAERNNSVEQAIQELQAIPGVTEKAQGEEEGEGGEQASSNTLESYVNRAKTLVKQRENLVAQFSPARKRSMLEYLLELSTKLDKDGLGLTMERLTLTPRTLFIKGRVKGFNELTAVRNMIDQSKLFEQVPLQGLINPADFSATINLTSKRP